MKTKGKITRVFLLLAFVVFVFSGCKTTRLVSDTNLKPLRTAKLIENIGKNALDYDNFTVKRISCQYRDEDEKATFRANVKAVKDSIIVVSFNKLNIPFGRIYLTPDSVKFLNHMDKTYFLGDYNFLKELFNIDIGFYDVQAILANNIFSYRNASENDFKNFESYTDSGMYVIQSINNRKLSKIETKDKQQKANRLIKRNNDMAFIFQKILVFPKSFNISEINIEDRTNGQKVHFGFSEYTEFKRRDYPGEINMNFNSEKGDINMRMKLSGFSTDKIKNLNFKIPKRYQQIMLR